MRPRFSLKWLLIAFTISGVAFYFCFVRPTALANRLVYLAEHDHLQSAESLFIDSSEPFELGSAPVVVRAILRPRSWQDVLKMQRQVDVQVFSTREQITKGGNYYPSTNFQATAGALGIRGSAKDVVLHYGLEKSIADRVARFE